MPKHTAKNETQPTSTTRMNWPTPFLWLMHHHPTFLGPIRPPRAEYLATLLVIHNR